MLVDGLQLESRADSDCSASEGSSTPSGLVREPPLDHLRPNAALELELGWNEVGCFLRPQSMLCDALGNGYGLAFLLLYSFYRCTNRDGYFIESAKQHFAFAQTVFEGFSGISFHVDRIGNEDEIPGAIVRALEHGGPVLVPGNIRLLPYYAGHGGDDQPHYFIVTGFDASTRNVMLCDNLHETGEATHARYSPHVLSMDLFSTVARAYHRAYVARPRDTPHGESSFWVLRIAAGPGFRKETELSILDRLLSKCGALLRAHAPGDTLSRVDRRHLAALRAAHASKEQERFERLVHAYLKEANMAALHVKLAIHALQRLAAPAAQQLAAGFDVYRRSSSLLRTQLCVRCLGPARVDDGEWQDAAAELTRRAAALVQAVLATNEIGTDEA